MIAVSHLVRALCLRRRRQQTKSSARTANTTIPTAAKVPATALVLLKNEELPFLSGCPRPVGLETTADSVTTVPSDSVAVLRTVTKLGNVTDV